MAQKLETIKGGGGSIRIGTAGTISSLMNKELESAASSSSYMPPPSSSSRLTTPTAMSVSLSCGHRSLKQRKSADEASTSTSSGSCPIITKHKSPEITRRTRGGSDPMTPKRQKQKSSQSDEGSSRRSPRRIHGRTRHAPMLGSEKVDPDQKPNREKALKKGINLIEIVDTSCGSPRASLSNRLRKLGFSKMSQSIM